MTEANKNQLKINLCTFEANEIDFFEYYARNQKVWANHYTDLIASTRNIIIYQ